MECVPLSKFLEAAPGRHPGFDSKVAMLLKNQYKCFQKESKESKRDTHNGRWNNKNVSTTPPRPAILAKLALTPEAATKKAFLSLMNKLADKNKDAIFSQVAKLQPFISIQTDIVWNICLESPSYQNLYIELLDILIGKVENGRELVSKTLEDRLSQYLETKSYLPPETVDCTEYDDFCDYVKWKKRSLATITLLITLESKGLVVAMEQLTAKFVESCDNLLVIKDYEKADIVLDQLFQIYTNKTTVNVVDTITPLIQKWFPDTEVMKPSTRFKFYAFSEFHEKLTKPAQVPVPVSNRWVSASVSAMTRSKRGDSRRS